MKKLATFLLFTIPVIGNWSAVQAGDVVMFRDQAPPADDLAEIMFPQESGESEKPKMRGIRFLIEDEQAPPPASTAKASEPPAAESGGTKDGSVVGFNIQFALGSSELLLSARPYLDSVGEMLNLERMRESRILIAGHADASGEQDFNRRLSEKRALAVRDYLVSSHGIGSERLTVAGYGESKPLPGTNPYDGINRRVEFHPLK